MRVYYSKIENFYYRKGGINMEKTTAEKVREQRISEAEAGYIRNIKSDPDGAYVYVGELMGLHAIEPTDKRIKKLKDEHYPLFRRDMREGTDFTMRWLFGELPSNIRVELETSAHDAKRIEGSYEGIIRVPQRTMILDIFEVKKTGQSKRLNDNIENIQKACGRGKIKMDISSLHSKGELAVLKIGLKPGQNFLSKEFGYVLVVRNGLTEKHSIKVVLILDDVNIDKCKLNLKKAKRAISDAIKLELEAINNCEVIVRSIDKLV